MQVIGRSAACRAQHTQFDVEPLWPPRRQGDVPQRSDGHGCAEQATQWHCRQARPLRGQHRLQLQDPLALQRHADVEQGKSDFDAIENLCSLLQTYVANGIDGYRYLRTLLVELPTAKTVEDFEALLHWRLASADR